MVDLVGDGLQTAASATDINTRSVKNERTTPRNFVRVNTFGILISFLKEGQPKSITDIPLAFARDSLWEKLSFGSIVVESDFFNLTGTEQSHNI